MVRKIIHLDKNIPIENVPPLEAQSLLFQQMQDERDQQRAGMATGANKQPISNPVAQPSLWSQRGEVS